MSPRCEGTDTLAYYILLFLISKVYDVIYVRQAVDPVVDFSIGAMAPFEKSTTSGCSL